MFINIIPVSNGLKNSNDKITSSDDNSSESSSKSQISLFLEDVIMKKDTSYIQIGNSKISVSLKHLSSSKIAKKFEERGILSSIVLAERMLHGLDFEEESKVLDISPLETTAIYQSALDNLDPVLRKELEAAAAHPKGKGGLNINDPQDNRILKALGVDNIRSITEADLKEWQDTPVATIYYVRRLGPTRAVDYRRTLGQAGDQGGRGTCTAFASSAVAESIEYFKDRRPGPRDLSEQLMFWYSHRGQIDTAGGYHPAAALRHYTEYGSCEEIYFPYNGILLSSNLTHSPAPDMAMDRAQFYTYDEVVRQEMLNDSVNHIQRVKNILESGRCVAISHDTDGWLNGTGEILFPSPLESRGRGGSHATAIIGYIDRDDLDPVMEGGYFIVRNSWGDAGSRTNVMGPEYGGHLRMPYGWFRRYVSCYSTLVARNHLVLTGTRWWVEYYANRSLQGIPEEIPNSIPPPPDPTGTVFEQETDQINFNWELAGPFVASGSPDDFSARYTQVRKFRPGWYRFTLGADDGVRLWVDDRLVINAWKDQPATEYVQEHYISGGDHVLRVEYYEHTVDAEVHLNIEPVLFHFEVFGNTDLSGSPTVIFDDTLTDLEWRHAPPGASLSSSNGQFSLRATGMKHFKAGQYCFHAFHTGGCRIWLDEELVLDDWDGINSTGNIVTVSEGSKNVKVEFRNLSTIPPPDGDHRYYRAALSFDWSNVAWEISVYYDQNRKTIAEAGFPNVDSIYEAFTTENLTGDPIFTHQYPADNNSTGQYFARDGLPLRLEFTRIEDTRIGGGVNHFTKGIPGSERFMPEWAGYIGAYITRRIYVAVEGWYTFSLSADDGHRLMVDGKQILQHQKIRDSDQFDNDLYLTAGVHDIAIEYANSGWGGQLKFAMDRTRWEVEYFSDTNFTVPHGTRTLDNVDKAISEIPLSLRTSDYYSIKCRRNILLPLGRYRVQIKTIGTVRLRAGGQNIIDFNTNDRIPSSYWSYFEHRGGNVVIELEYEKTQRDAALVELKMVPEGFYCEYYQGTALERPLLGSSLDRNVPIAYRFEPTIDFDWGNSGPLPRVGADNFSVRYYGSVNLPVGRWAINVSADDGVRLFLDGRLLIDQWRDRLFTTNTKVIDMVDRNHNLCLEYYERTGTAKCKLTFRRLY